MIPIIVQLSIVLFTIFMTLFALGVDLLDKGCLAWHRDSIGYLVQALIAYICLLVTSVNLMQYMEEYEKGVVQHRIMHCFVPILVLSVLWILKIVVQPYRSS